MRTVGVVTGTTLLLLDSLLSRGVLAAEWSKRSRNVGLLARSVQSEAVCLGQFSWMDNAEEQNPCLAAAFLLGACGGGDFTVPALTDPRTHYTPPNSTTANECSCSWATYNLLQGCAFCQGTNYSTAIFDWDPWHQNCTDNLLSNTRPFPSDVVIPDETSIPFWAATDPTTWVNHRFDPQSAQSLASENKPGITQKSRSATKKRTPVGAIAGGVVGGAAFLLALGVALFVLRRRRRSRRKAPSQLYGASAHSLFASKQPGSAQNFAGSSAVVMGLPASPLSSAYHASYPGSAIAMDPMSPPGLRQHAQLSGTIVGTGPPPPSAYAHAHARTHSDQSTASQSASHVHTASLASSEEFRITPFVLPPAPFVRPADAPAHGPDPDAPPARKPRRNPPAYTPVSSPEDAMFRSRAEAALSLAGSVDAPPGLTLSGSSTLGPGTAHTGGAAAGSGTLGAKGGRVLASAPYPADVKHRP